MRRAAQFPSAPMSWPITAEVANGFGRVRRIVELSEHGVRRALASTVRLTQPHISPYAGKPQPVLLATVASPLPDTLSGSSASGAKTRSGPCSAPYPAEHLRVDVAEECDVVSGASRGQLNGMLTHDALVADDVAEGARGDATLGRSTPDPVQSNLLDEQVGRPVVRHGRHEHRQIDER